MNRAIRRLSECGYRRMATGKSLGLLRLLTWSWRLMPRFVVIGAQKSGTTSLYRYIARHPCVAPALIKEPDYFCRFFGKGIMWYRAHFVTRVRATLARAIYDRALITGEASTNYLWHPHAPRRMYETVPDVKLIVLLRDPVGRAYSHYQMQVRRGREELSFEQAVAEESRRLDGEMERMLADRDYYSVAYRWYGYVSKGMYASQLRNWLGRFSREQVLVLRSESLSAQPSRTMERVFQFLGLPHREHDAYERSRVGRYEDVRVAVRERLQGFYAPYNRELSDLLGMEINWG